MRKRLLVEIQRPDRPSRRESRLGAAGRRQAAGQHDRLGLAAEYRVIRHRQIEPQCYSACKVGFIVLSCARLMVE
jgi:hypothetical protein